MNKNILILTIVLFALVAALGAMLMLSKNPAPAVTLNGATIAQVNKNISELNSLDAELALFANDDLVVQELDATLNEVGEINEASASLIDDEANLNSLAQDLNNSSNDELTNQEMDQALQEAAL